jgi:hypothetical protein
MRVKCACDASIAEMGECSVVWEVRDARVYVDADRAMGFVVCRMSFIDHSSYFRSSFLFFVQVTPLFNAVRFLEDIQVG